MLRWGGGLWAVRDDFADPAIRPLGDRTRVGPFRARLQPARSRTAFRFLSPTRPMSG
jgi:hypothetical protein